MRGTLGEKTVIDLIRELGESRGTGLLRFSKTSLMKAIFFEEGRPVFAISNIPSEQIDYRLVHLGVCSKNLIEAVRQKLPNKQQVGPALISSGLVSSDAYRSQLQEAVKQIILSLFEWEDADYVFEEGLSANHETKIDWSAADCILEGARHLCTSGEWVGLLAPLDKSVRQAPPERCAFGTAAKLSPIESFVFSRVDSPTPVGEVGTFTGLPEEEARKALCVLITLGLLTLSGGDTAANTKVSEQRVRKLREEVTRRLSSLPSADYYEILGVTNLATTNEIEAAYNRLKQKFDPALYPQPEHQELRSRLERLLEKIEQAFDTLADINKRRTYDEQKIRLSMDLHKQPQNDVSARPGPVAQMPVQPGGTSGHLYSEVSSPLPSYNPGSAAPAPAGTANEAQSGSQPEMADYYYRLGREKYEERDCHRAVQLLREAVKHDDSRPHYHYFLGMALTVISQARHDQHHDGCHVTCKLGKVLISNPRLRREAEQHFLRAAELDPTSVQVKLRLALLYKEADLPKRAEQYFREVITLDPGNKTALQELGIVEG